MTARGTEVRTTAPVSWSSGKAGQWVPLEWRPLTLVDDPIAALMVAIEPTFLFTSDGENSQQMFLAIDSHGDDLGQRVDGYTKSSPGCIHVGQEHDASAPFRDIKEYIRHLGDVLDIDNDDDDDDDDDVPNLVLYDSSDSDEEDDEEDKEAQIP